MARLRQAVHGLLKRVLPDGPRRRLSTWLRARGFQPDAHYRIRLEYPTSASNSPRWDPHPELERIIASGHETYEEALATIAAYGDSFAAIPMGAEDSREPSWENEWLPPLDGAALYAFLRSRSPGLYMEVGSGNSTKFAARARRAGALETRIVSIDPHPRAEVDALCDRVLREPLEAADSSVFADLADGDVLFVDGSHRTFMNSDATVFFLEVLPRLVPGVLVGVHDVFLPYDYPQEIADRYYSEQYLLAAHLMASNPALEPVLPAYYAGRRLDLRPVGEALGPGLEPHGNAFWLRTRARA